MSPICMETGGLLEEGRYAKAPLAAVECYGKSEAINFSNAKLSPLKGNCTEIDFMLRSRFGEVCSCCS